MNANLRSLDELSAIALASIAVAILVTAIKYAAYAWTGSVALYSDAMESIVNVVAAVIRAQTGVVIDPLTLHPVLALAPAGMIALGALAGIVPAWKAYRTDVAENLVPSS